MFFVRSGCYGAKHRTFRSQRSQNPPPVSLDPEAQLSSPWTALAHHLLAVNGSYRLLPAAGMPANAADSGKKMCLSEEGN